MSEQTAETLNYLNRINKKYSLKGNEIHFRNPPNTETYNILLEKGYKPITDNPRGFKK